MTPCVYILTNSGNTVLYVGVTSDLKQRVMQHRNGIGSLFTLKYRLRKVVFVERHPTMMSAISREKQVKSWNRERKVALISDLNPMWRDLMPYEE